MGKWADWFRRLFGTEETPGREYVDVSASDLTFLPQQPLEKKRSWLTKWTPGAQRERQIAWLQAGYSEMLTLIRGINAHLERQEDIQHKLVTALEQLPSSLESLKSLGKAVEQQVEALALLRDQLARSSDHDQKLVASMENFNKTLGLLDETARASGRTVAELVQQAREEDRLLHDLVQRSEKRIMIIIGLFVGALIVVMAAAGYALFKVRAATVSRQMAENVSAPTKPVAPLPESRPAIPTAEPAISAAEATPTPGSDVPNTASSVSPEAPMTGSSEEALTAANESAESAQSEAIAESTPDESPAKPKKSRRSWFRKRPRKNASDSEISSAAEAEKEGEQP